VIIPDRGLHFEGTWQLHFDMGNHAEEPSREWCSLVNPLLFIENQGLDGMRVLLPLVILSVPA